MIAPFKIGLFALATLAALAACAPAAPTGSDARSASPAKPRFVSLNPCLDAILVEVAEPEQILAISHYSHQPGGSRMEPERARRFAYTGGSAEEVIALAPDIVLASVFLAPSTKAAFERAGLRVETFDSPRTVAESARQVERMAKLAGDPGKADSLVQALAPLRTPSAGSASRPSVLLWQPGQIVAGERTLIAELIREAGFTSHAAALGLKQADYVPIEALLSDPPDLLLVAGESAGQRHPALRQLEQTRTASFDPSLFYCGGPSVPAARPRLQDLRRAFERSRK
ncbi:MAG: helical backbone metal receptor [Pseudomonadota bacterium]